MTNWNNVDQLVKVWLEEAGQKIAASFETSLDIHTKANANDLVTNMDRETEQYFIRNIRAEFPTHKVMSEEGFGDTLKDLEGVIWVIDPVDGTMNFVHQQRNFFISIGIYEDGKGKLGYLYDVVHKELYYAKVGEGAFLNEVKLAPLEEVAVEEALIGLNTSWLATNRYIDPEKTLMPLVKDVRGVRSYGSAALEFAYVATGRLDAYISMRLAPWDFAGGKIVVEELGGIVTNLKGESVSLMGTSSIVVAAPGLHEKIIQDYLNKE